MTTLDQIEAALDAVMVDARNRDWMVAVLRAKEALADLRTDLAPIELPVRQGSRVPQNIYDANNRPICQCHTEDDARRIVAAMNAARTGDSA